MSIVRVGLSQTQKFGAGYDAIFKSRKAAPKAAKPKSKAARQKKQPARKK